MGRYIFIQALSGIIFSSFGNECAFAQDLSAFPMSPETVVQDEFGVNLLSATWTYRTKQLLHSEIDPELDFYLISGNGGAKWGSSLQAYVVGNASNLTTQKFNVVIGEENTSFSRAAGTNTFTDGLKRGNTLTYNDTTKKFTFTRRDGVKYIFDTSIFESQPPGSTGNCNVGRKSSVKQLCGAAVSATFPDGKFITFDYKASYSLSSASLNTYNTYATLTGAHSSNGISVMINSSNGATVTKIINDAFEYCDYASSSCSNNYTWPSLSYPGSAGMTITDQTGATFRHTVSIHASDFQAFKSGPSGALAVHYQNDQEPGGRDGSGEPTLIDYTGADGIKYTYRYTNVSTPDGLREIHGVRTSSDGRVYSFVGNKASLKSWLIVQATDEIGRTKNISYDAYDRPIGISLPEGNSEIYTYDNNGNITTVRRKAKPSSGISDLLKVVTYPSSCSGPLICNKPISITDERGGVTNYVWDSVTGNMLSQTFPADANGVRPVRRYNYANMYTWVRNGSGGYVQSASPRSMLVEERTCISTATVNGSCAGGSSDEVVTAYYYGPQSGPNNLLLRGKSITAGGVTLVECYGYDRLGNRISTTKANANVQVCP